MEVKFTTEELVDLFSTSTYGNSAMGADYHNGDTTEHVGECWEDVLAYILEHGGTIDLIDAYAEGDAQGKYEDTAFQGEDDPTYWMRYPITLKDMETRLADFMDSGNEDVRYVRKLYYMLKDEDCSFDMICAWNLMQVVMFGEIIYG